MSLLACGLRHIFWCFHKPPQRRNTRKVYVHREPKTAFETCQCRCGGIICYKPMDGYSILAECSTPGCTHIIINGCKAS